MRASSPNALLMVNQTITRKPNPPTIQRIGNPISTPGTIHGRIVVDSRVSRPRYEYASSAHTDSIERISGQLTSNSWVAYGKKPATSQSIEQISHQLSHSLVEVVVDLAETHIATSDLLELQVGDIITTEKDVRQPMVVSIEGRPKFHADPGVLKGRKAVQVSEMIGEPVVKR